MNHAIQRARERYGLTLTPDDLTALQADVAAGRSLLIRRNDDGSAIHALLVNTVTALVVIAADGSIVTFLPPRSTQVFPAPRRNRRAA